MSGMEGKKFHDLKLLSTGTYLDGFKIKGILNKKLRLEKLGNGTYQPILTLEIGFAPRSNLIINSGGNNTGGNLGKDI